MNKGQTTKVDQAAPAKTGTTIAFDDESGDGPDDDQAADTLEALCGQQLEHFRVEGQIGEGGMGTVFEAHDLSLDRPVAIKVISAKRMKDPTLRERFVREAQAQARLVHPNVVQIHYIGEQDGMLFFAMELVHGEALDASIARNETLAWPRAVELLIAVSSALRQAHRAGIGARDIKPSNLLLDEEGMIKVADFGLAKKVEAADDLQLTQKAP